MLVIHRSINAENAIERTGARGEIPTDSRRQHFYIPENGDEIATHFGRLCRYGVTEVLFLKFSEDADNPPDGRLFSVPQARKGDDDDNEIV
jgi:hypothetical protein